MGGGATVIAGVVTGSTQLSGAVSLEQTGLRRHASSGTLGDTIKVQAVQCRNMLDAMFTDSRYLASSKNGVNQSRKKNARVGKCRCSDNPIETATDINLDGSARQRSTHVYEACHSASIIVWLRRM